MGILQPILTSPEKEEILDVRTPYFTVPPWTTDPFPQDEEEEEPEMTLDHGRFAIKRALSFSNTGGVYLAVDQTTGKDVVIKEGRPFVEVDRHGHDAISRLKREAMMLSLINGQGIAPMPIATFSDWENSYFVEEYFDATDLREIMLIHTPVLRVNPSTSDSEGFYAIFKSIFVSLLTGISRIHRLGIVICDMSPVNILVDKTSYAARIIDFEAAYRLGIDDPSELYTPGFRSLESIRRDIRGYYDDLYAVAMLMVYSMFPIAVISSLRDDLFSNILPIILSDMGWSQTRLLEIITGLATDTMTCDRACELLEMPTVFETPLSTANSRQEATLQDYYSGLAQFLSHSYRTDDHFTLFPSDPFAGRTNAVGLGFGSSGVIYSLTKCGFDVPQPALDRFAREIGEVKSQDLAPGILTGHSGIALVFFGLEDTNQAERFMGYANSSLLLRRHHSLYYGMAGIGMSNLVAYRQTKDTKYLNVAQDLAKTLAENAKEDPNGIYWEDDGVIHLGLGYGQSGVALFFLRLSQVLGISDWRELGRRALSYDLSHGYAIEPGVLSFTSTPDDHITYEQYIEEGSAGIAKVAIRYGIWDDIDYILADVHRKYSGFAGLLFGTSGFVDVLVDAYIYSGNAKYLEMAKRPIAGLRDLYLIKQPHGYATPGDNLFRISCDYATGVSGVMRTLYRMAHLTQSDFTLDELDSEARLRDSACIGKPTLQRTSHV
jgi:serine/threonine protein kinase